MEQESKIKETLENIVGKKFVLDELAVSLEISSAEIIDFLFDLKDQEEIEFLSFSDGTLRISRLGNIVAKGEFVKTKDIKHTFPEDIKIFKLVNFSLTLPQKLRIEFDKCMADNEFVEKFKKISESEVLEILNERASIFKKQNEEMLERQRLEKKKLRISKQEEAEFINKSSQLTPEERMKVKEQQKIHNVMPTSKNKDINFEVEKQKKLNAERQANKIRYGHHETNQERYERLARELKTKQLDKKEAFQQNIENRKDYVDSYKLGEIVEGTVTKIIANGMYVNIGKSDGFVHVDELRSPRSLKFLKHMRQGNTLNFEIIDIDFNRKNIDLIPTSKKIVKEQNDTIVKQQEQLVEIVLQKIIDNGGSESLKFLLRLITKCSKDNSSEWALVPSESRLKKIRLINSGIVACVVDSESITLTVLNNQTEKNTILQELIDEYVPPRKRQGFFRNVPSALPLSIPHKVASKHKKILYSAFLESFKLTVKSGKNPMKASHSVYLINQLSDKFSKDLMQPTYIN